MTGFTSVFKKIGNHPYRKRYRHRSNAVSIVSSLLTGAASKLGATGTAITAGIGDPRW